MTDILDTLWEITENYEAYGEVSLHFVYDNEKLKLIELYDDELKVRGWLIRGPVMCFYEQPQTFMLTCNIQDIKQAIDWAETNQLRKLSRIADGSNFGWWLSYD